MNAQWSDEVKERYTKDQEFYAQCSARGIQIRLNTDTLELEGHMTRKPVGITAPYRKDDDDDIQDYKKPWVGLTVEEVDNITAQRLKWQVADLVYAIEEALRRKNT